MGFEVLPARSFGEAAVTVLFRRFLMIPLWKCESPFLSWQRVQVKALLRQISKTVIDKKKNPVKKFNESRRSFRDLGAIRSAPNGNFILRNC